MTGVGGETWLYIQNVTLESWLVIQMGFYDTKMSGFLSFGDWYMKDIRKIRISIGQVLVQKWMIPSSKTNEILTSITTNSWSASKITNPITLNIDWINIT